MTRTRGDIRDELIRVLNEAEVLEGDYVHFERVWANTRLLRQCANLVAEDLELLDKGLNFIPQSKNLIILTPDTVEGRLGALPLSFFVAEKMGINVVVWKEYADFLWGRAKLIGDVKSANKVAVLLQDVFESGTTAQKICYTLKRLKKLDWRIPLHYTVVHGGRKEYGEGAKGNELFDCLKTETKREFGVSVRDLRARKRYEQPK